MILRTENYRFRDADKYLAGKWGRYLRAPGFYFDVMRKFGSGFVPLGEIANIRFGVKSGCDAFFMPHDVTCDALQNSQTNAEFKRRYGLDRSSVENKSIRIVRAGDGSEHPIEAEWLKIIIRDIARPPTAKLASQGAKRLKHTIQRFASAQSIVIDD
jgi:hypothetical protein